jgi:hypothetical protein
MKFMTTWTLIPGSAKDAIAKFLAGEAAPQPNVKLLGRWHSVDGSGGWSLYETDSLAALHMGAAKWADLLEISTTAVIEDAEAGANFSTLSKS